MPDVNLAAIAVAGVVVFLFAATWYARLAPVAARLSAAWAEPGGARPLVAVLELAKGVLVAGVVAALLDAMGVVEPVGGVAVAVGLWLAFPVVLLAGSIVHERVHPRLAAIHAGDWLAKLVLVALVVTAWP